MDRSEPMALTVKELHAKDENLDVKHISSLNEKDSVETAKNADDKASDSSKLDDNTKNEKSVSEDKSEKTADAADDAVKSSKKISAAKSDKADDGDKKVKKDVKAEDADDVEDDEDADDVDDEDDVEDEDSDSTDKPKVKKAKKAKKAKSVKEEEVKEPAPFEPSSIFIDHGAILPEYVPGTCLYALVRDPGTLFVYWNASFESSNGWLLTAYDAAGNELQSFKTPARRNGRGYFRIPTARVARVTLSIVTGYGSSEVKLESKIKIAQQLGIAQPAPKFDERWVDVQNHEVIYEAPSYGRAPAFSEVYPSMTGAAMTGGGFDRSFESQNGNPAAPNQMGSTSSRFGSLNAPGSSDILIASSGSLVRR